MPGIWMWAQGEPFNGEGIADRATPTKIKALYDLRETCSGARGKRNKFARGDVHVASFSNFNNTYRR